MEIESDDPVMLRRRVPDLEAEIVRLRALTTAAHDMEARQGSAISRLRHDLVRARGDVEASQTRVEGLESLHTTLTARGLDHSESVRLQTMLTQEMSHRVKNNLQLVVSLLQLQLRSLRDPDARNALEDASARVATIAEVHDQLWRHDEVRRVDLTAYLRGLCERVQGTSPAARIVFEGEPVTVASDRAVPLALIANELVTNALKYAYPEGRSGDIRVRLGGAGPGHVRLEISDRGVGLPQGFEAGRQKSFGMKLVTNLMRQLEGELGIDGNDPGARFVLTFPQHSAYDPEAAA